MLETLPFAWYADPDILRLEDERIFPHAWQYVGHTGELVTRASLTATVGGIRVVVARDSDGALRAEAPGRGPAAADTWGPFVFANPDADAQPLGEALGPLPASLRELGVDVDALVFHHRVDWELATNWKIACENFLECYHCPVAHRGFAELVDVSPDAYRLSTHGLTSSQYGPTRANGGGPLGRSEFHFLWPNTGLNVFPGRVNLSIGPILPAGAERTRRYLDYFFGAGVDESWIAELLELDDAIGREDAALVEGVQRGVRSGAVARGALLSESEQLVAHFQRLTAAALAD